MSGGVTKYTYAEHLHDPHSILEIGHPDSEVWVVAVADILEIDDELPVVTINNIKVYPELYSDEFEDATQDQLDFWDLGNRILEQYIWGQQTCMNCPHKLSLHMEQEADFLGCCVNDCDCAGEKSDLTP